jgi:hypothetical protein
MKKNNSTPVVVRLNSSEEIFGTGKQVGNVFKITNPLIMETQDSVDGETFVFMTRWNKYSDDRTTSIPMDMVLYVHPLSELMIRYYEKSLTFVEKEMEPRFISGIEQAITQIEAAIKPDATEVLAFEPENQTEERLQEIRGKMRMSLLATPSKANH